MEYIEMVLNIQPDNEGAIALKVIVLLSMNLVNEAYTVVVKYIKTFTGKRPLPLFFILKARIEEEYH